MLVNGSNSLFDLSLLLLVLSIYGNDSYFIILVYNTDKIWSFLKIPSSFFNPSYWLEALMVVEFLFKAMSDENELFLLNALIYVSGIFDNRFAILRFCLQSLIWSC